VELPSFINENYKDFLNNLKVYETKQGNSPYTYYKLYLPIYLNWQIQLRELSNLVTELRTCIQSLRNAYGALDDFVSAANAGNEMPKEIIQLDKDYLSLLNTIAKFSDARDRLFKITY